jgi:hypothetical protein
VSDDSRVSRRVKTVGYPAGSNGRGVSGRACAESERDGGDVEKAGVSGWHSTPWGGESWCLSDSSERQLAAR